MNKKTTWRERESEKKGKFFSPNFLRRNSIKNRPFRAREDFCLLVFIVRVFLGSFNNKINNHH